MKKPTNQHQQTKRKLQTTPKSIHPLHRTPNSTFSSRNVTEPNLQVQRQLAPTDWTVNKQWAKGHLPCGDTLNLFRPAFIITSLGRMGGSGRSGHLLSGRFRRQTTALLLSLDRCCCCSCCCPLSCFGRVQRLGIRFI